MVASRGSEENRTTLGIGEIGDPQFTLSSAHEHAVFAYGFEPGSAKRLNPEQRFSEEVSPTLRAEMGDNQAAVICLNDQGGSVMDASIEESATLRAQEHGHQPSVFCLQGNGIDRADTARCNGKGWREDVSYTLNTIDRTAVYDARGNGDGKIVPTMTGDHQSRITDYTAICIESKMQDYDRCWQNKEYEIDTEINGTLQAKEQGQNLNSNNVCRIGSVVRRLTPLEAERLQGFPDKWTDIGDWVDSKGKKRKCSDGARYKSLGNSIALPFWQWLARRICAQYEGDITMGSLFDGISGFPLVFARCGARPVWTSEIEEFPIAVCKRHFGDEETGEEGDYRLYL